MKILAYVGALAGAALIGAPTTAATYTITYTGYAQDGQDNLGIWNTPTGNLAGLPFKAVYYFTYPKAGSEEFSVVVTGSGAANPLAGEFTLGSITLTLPNPGNGYVRYLNDYYGLDGVEHTYQGSYENGHAIYLHLNVGGYFDFLDPVGFGAEYETDAGPVSSAGSTFIYAGLNGYSAGGRLVVTHVKAEISAAPAPATWIMAVVGFGMVGATMRSRGKARVRFV